MKEDMLIVLSDILQSESKNFTVIRDDRDSGNIMSVDNVTSLTREANWFQRQFSILHTTWTSFVQGERLEDRNHWRRHREALFCGRDALAYSLLLGKGSWGFVGLEGLVKYSLLRCLENKKLAWLKPYIQWVENYDEFGNDLTTIELTDPCQLLVGLSRLSDLDAAILHTFREEYRCAVHFLTLLQVSAESKLTRERILFQKFLRENRFRLASNGVLPPPEIFSSSSYASVDLALVAVWLSSLSVEEYERFQILKEAFSEEQKSKDKAIDEEDFQLTFNALALERERESRDDDMSRKLRQGLVHRLEQRVRLWAEKLTPGDQVWIFSLLSLHLIDDVKILLFKLKFEVKREEWLGNADCKVDLELRPLYKRFREAIMGDAEEATEYARQVLQEVIFLSSTCFLLLFHEFSQF